MAWRFFGIVSGVTLFGAVSSWAFFMPTPPWSMESRSNLLISHEFYGLNFTARQSVTCQRLSQTLTMSCVMADGDGVGIHKPLLHMELFYRPVVSAKQRALVRLNRQHQWYKQFPSLTHYVERPIKTGLGQIIAQEARYLRLNNTFWPVLLRAFDVVVHKDALISFTIWADENDWPLVEKKIDEIMQSFKRAVIKR